jgi:O-antigen ligase
VITTTATTAGRGRKKGSRHQRLCALLIPCGVIALVVFSPLALGAVHAWAYTIVELAVLLLYLCWIVQSLNRSSQAHEPRWKLTVARTPLNLPLCLLMGVVLFQICPLPVWFIKVVSPSTYSLYFLTLPSVSEATARTLSIYPWASAQELWKLLTYIGVFYLVIYHFRDRVWLNRLIKAIVMTGFLIAVIGILQHFALPKMIYGLRDASYAFPFGPYINRNHFAGYMEMAIFVGIGLFLSLAPKTHPPRGRWRSYLSRWEAKISKQILLGFSVVVMAVALALSLSRGGITSAIVALVFMGGMMVVRKRRSSVILVVVLFSFALFYLLWLGIGPVIERLATIGYWDTTMGYRLQTWQGAMDMVKDFYPFGTGLGTFIYIFPRYQTIGASVIFDHAENDYVEFFSDLGLIGGALLWIGFFWFLLWVLKRWSARRYPSIVMLCLGCMSGVIALLLHSAVDFNLHIPANALLFFVLLAVGFNTVLLRGEGKGMAVIAPTRVFTIPRIGRLLFLFLVLCAFVLLGGGVIRSYLAERAVSDVQEKIALYTHGKRFSWVDVDTLLRLQQAQELSPGYALPHYLLAKAYEQMALAQRGEEAKAVFLDLAAREYKIAIDLQPTSAWYHLGLGWTYLALSERYHTVQADAKREFEIAAQLAPNDLAIQRYLREISIVHAP